MKTYQKILSLSLLCLTLSKPLTSLAQQNHEVVIGAGYPELLFVGYRLPATDKSQFEFTFSRLNTSEERLLSIGGNLIYHFKRPSDSTKQSNLYIKSGINYIQDETDQTLFKNVLLTGRFGKRYLIGEHFRFNMDAGFMIIVAGEEVDKQPTNTGWDVDFPDPMVLPSLSLSISYGF